MRKYDNSRNTQRARIMCLLKKFQSRTTLDFRAAGILHPAGRIRELRLKGVNIATYWSNETDNNSVYHRVARYFLIKDAAVN